MVAAQNVTQGAFGFSKRYTEKVSLEKAEIAQRKKGAALSQMSFQECSDGVHVKIQNHCLRCWQVLLQDESEHLSSQVSWGKHDFLRDSWASTWDEEQKKLVTFKGEDDVRNSHLPIPLCLHYHWEEYNLFLKRLRAKIKHAVSQSGWQTFTVKNVYAVLPWRGGRLEQLFYAFDG